MKILDVLWFSGSACIGIVKVEDEFDGIKYYINSCSGMDEEVDKQHIADWGTTFPFDIGEQLFSKYS